MCSAAGHPGGPPEEFEEYDDERGPPPPGMLEGGFRPRIPPRPMLARGTYWGLQNVDASLLLFSRQSAENRYTKI